MDAAQEQKSRNSESQRTAGPDTTPGQQLADKLSFKVYSAEPGTPEAAEKQKALDSDMKLRHPDAVIKRALDVLINFAGEVKVTINGQQRTVNFKELATRKDVRIEVADDIDAAWVKMNPGRPGHHPSAFVQSASEKTGGATLIVLDRKLFDQRHSYTRIIKGESPFVKVMSVLAHELTHIAQPHNAQPGAPGGSIRESQAELEALEVQKKAIATVFGRVQNLEREPYFKATQGVSVADKMSHEKDVMVAMGAVLGEQIKIWQERAAKEGPAAALPPTPAPKDSLTFGEGRDRIVVPVESQYHKAIKDGLDRGYQVSTVSGRGDIVFNIKDPATKTERDVILSQKHRKPEDFAHVLALQIEAQTARTELFSLLKKEGISFMLHEHELGSATHKVSLRNAAGISRSYNVAPREADRDYSHLPVSVTTGYQGWEIQVLEKVKEFISGKPAATLPPRVAAPDKAEQASTAAELDPIARTNIAAFGNEHHSLLAKRLEGKDSVEMNEKKDSDAESKMLFIGMRKALGLPETTLLTLKLEADANEIIISVNDAESGTALGSFGLAHDREKTRDHSAASIRGIQYLLFPDALEARKSSLIKEGAKMPKGMVDLRGFHKFD